MKKICQKHKKNVEKYDGDLKQLAEDIGDLHYDALQWFMLDLAVKLQKDAEADKKRGRKKLSKSLYNASLKVSAAAMDIREAWYISKPYME